MKITGYHHIGLKVVDVEKSYDFYVNGLGGTETMRFPMGNSGLNMYMVDLGGNAVVELMQQGTAEKEENARFAHIALRTDDIHAAYDIAVKAGATPRIPPRDITLAGIAMINAFVKGPDGEDIEYVQVKQA